MFEDGLRCGQGKSSWKDFEKVRHFSFSCHLPEFNFVIQGRGLRTFLPLPSQIHFNHIYISSQKNLLGLLPNLDYIRVLSLAYYSIYKLPNSVGKLKQLRYLDLSLTQLKWLPESLTTLINLKVLILRDCFCLTKLPANMENLFNLCHLDIAGTLELHEMPPGIGELTGLHTLSKVIVSKSGGMRLKGLGNLSHLQGEISIENLQNVVNVQEAKDAKLIDKQNLDKISLKWSTMSSDSQDDEILQMDVLNALKPHENLSSLDINGYGGTSFSNWIGDPTFSKLASISLNYCRKCTNLPPLGRLSFLRELCIRGMSQVKVIGDGFYGNRDHGEIPFPSLETLSFDDMRNWEEWLGLGNEVEGVIELPRLRILSIEGCPKLVRLPILSLPSLRELHASNSPSLKMSTALHDSSTTLESLSIRCLVNLNLTNLLGSVHTYSSLASINLYNSDGLESFPDGGLPTPNLRSLEIWNCRNLKSLPRRMDLLLSLQILKVVYCPSLIEPFPRGNVPPNLTELLISKCGNQKSPGKWELHKLTSLQYLSFSPSDVDDNDDDDDDEQHYVLPPSLTLLELSNIKTLPKGFQNLTSLRHLVLLNCPKLMTMPMKDQLGKLSMLRIHGCPLLKQRCLNNKGEYWPIIANIPQVLIDSYDIRDDQSSVPA